MYMIVDILCVCRHAGGYVLTNLLCTYLQIGIWAIGYRVEFCMMV